MFEFHDVAAEAGVSFNFATGGDAGLFTILEGNGGGVGILDYEPDGNPDLFLPGGGGFTAAREILGAPAALYRQEAAWRFRSVAPFAGIEPLTFYAQGCSAGDFDNDGFVDLVVYGFRGLRLLHNQGDGTFLDTQSSAGLSEDSWANSAGWGDLNGDGNLDLYLVHYVNWSFENHPTCTSRDGMQPDVCGPKRFSPLPDRVFHSTGDGGFRDATTDAGLRKDGMGLGVLLANLDDDHALDIYVANDSGANFLYMNDGRGALTDKGEMLGAALDDSGRPNGSMGVELLDFDGDGQQDIWVANFEYETFALYHRQTSGGYLHVSRVMGITALGNLLVGWGTVAGDFDLDGDEDLAVANGHVAYHPHAAPRAQPFVLLRNDRPRKAFTLLKQPATAYTGVPHNGRGMARGDLDRDGDVDLVVANVDEPVALLRNETETANGSVAVRLIGRESNRNAIGARLTLRTTSGDQVRQICGGGSYCSQNDLEVVWGVPKGATVTGLTIDWPLGTRQEVPIIDGSPPSTIIEPDDGGITYK